MNKEDFTVYREVPDGNHITYNIKFDTMLTNEIKEMHDLHFYDFRSLLRTVIGKQDGGISMVYLNYGDGILAIDYFPPRRGLSEVEEETEEAEENPAGLDEQDEN